MIGFSDMRHSKICETQCHHNQHVTAANYKVIIPTVARMRHFEYEI